MINLYNFFSTWTIFSGIFTSEALFLFCRASFLHQKIFSFKEASNFPKTSFLIQTYHFFFSTNVYFFQEYVFSKLFFYFTELHFYFKRFVLSRKFAICRKSFLFFLIRMYHFHFLLLVLLHGRIIFFRNKNEECFLFYRTSFLLHKMLPFKKASNIQKISFFIQVYHICYARFSRCNFFLSSLILQDFFSLQKIPCHTPFNLGVLFLFLAVNFSSGR